MENNDIFKSTVKTFSFPIIFLGIFTLFISNEIIKNTFFIVSEELNLYPSLINIKILILVQIVISIVMLIKVLLEEKFLSQKNNIIIYMLVCIATEVSICYFLKCNYSIMTFTTVIMILVFLFILICLKVAFFKIYIEYKEFINVNHTENIEKDN